MNRLGVFIGILLAFLALDGCVSSHTTYIVERDGSGTYDRFVTVAPAAVALYRAENLDDDPDTPFATTRTAVLNALHRQGFPDARLDATTDSYGLRLHLHVPVRDARHLTRLDDIMAEELGPLAPRHEFALQRLPTGWQASCQVSPPVPRGEAAEGLAMALGAIAGSDSFAYPDTESDSCGDAMLDHVCAGHDDVVEIKVPAVSGGDTTVHWQVSLRTMLLDDILHHTLVAPPARLSLPATVLALPPTFAAASPDTNAVVAELAMRHGRYDEALCAARAIGDRDRRDAMLESIADQVMSNRLCDYDTVNLIMNLLQSPGRRTRLQDAIIRRQEQDTAIAADEAANWRDELPDDTILIAEVTANLDSGWFSDAASGAGNIRDTSARDALLLRAARGLMIAGEFAEVENILPRLGVEARVTATELLGQERAAVTARTAMEQQVNALYQLVIHAGPSEYAKLWRETETILDRERQAFLRASIAYSTAEKDLEPGLALARSIADTASLHRANALGAIATLLLDAQRDTEGWTVLAEAATAAADISNVVERCSVLGYVAQEFARTGHDTEALAIIHQALPQLASLPATQDFSERDKRRTAAEWLALAGALLHDKAIANAALALDDDETWRAQVRQRMPHP